MVAAGFLVLEDDRVLRVPADSDGVGRQRKSPDPAFGPEFEVWHA
jgi:hypothetical protein